MDFNLMEGIFGLISSVSLVTIIKFLVDYGKRLQKADTNELEIKQHEKRLQTLDDEITSLKEATLPEIKEELNSIKNSTEVRLATIETQLASVNTSIIEVGKDVKNLLRAK